MAFTISLADKSVVVTGASSGIGAAIARAMATAGAHVAAVGRNAEKLHAVVGEIAGGGGSARAIVADVNDEEAPARIVEEVTASFGGLDCLVNNAGIFVVAAPDDSLELLDRQWRTNVRAPYALTIAALPALRARRGNVIFLSSIAGQVGFASASAYCATKGAVEQLTRSLAVDEGANGVRFNAIAPGNIETPMNAHLMADPAYRKAMIDNTPAGRNGRADEIAPLSVLLASDCSAFTTGASILVDGGWAAR
jgi:NAD(P)-dependent dehydrogenase (short-subunit alcohol dehydrogenase family)